jgi:succinate dehydrogenase/fumarate reductase-like Fe-S protein
VSDEKWNVTFIITRQKGDEAPFTQSFPIEVDPDEYVLDGVERIWAFQTAAWLTAMPATIPPAALAVCA